jgi:hypothetical protein
MKTISWILLTVVVLLIGLAGLGSTYIAYFGAASNDVITSSTTLENLQITEETATALRGRRGTAAAFALGFVTLLLFVILGPYRKGALWAWWAILCSTATVAGFMLLRIPALGTSQGATTGGFLLVAVLVGLLLDVRRLTGRKGGA